MLFHMLGMDRLPPFTWVGYGSDALWTNPQNWSDNSVPGLSDTARFTKSACASNCSPSITANISIGGIIIDSTYPGTITQSAGSSIIVGSAGWNQAGGTFMGGNSDITINSTFNLSGGVFTSTSGQLLVTSGFSSVGAVFNHNNGLLKFDNNGIVAANSTINVSVPSNLELWNLQYSGGYASANGTYRINLAAGSLNVLNDFRIGLTAAGATGSIFASGGSIQVKRHLIVDSSVKIETNATPTNVIINGTGAQNYTSTSGRLPVLEINKPSGTFTPTGGTTNLVVESFLLQAGSFTAPPGVLTVLGNFTVSGGTYIENSGSLAFERYPASGTSFTISLLNPLSINNLSFGGGQSGSSASITRTITGANPRFNVAGNLSILNTQSGTGTIITNGGEIYLAGNYSAGAYSGDGNTSIIFNGSGAQTFSKTGVGSNFTGPVVVDKSAGTLTLLTVANLNSGGQNFTITSGTVNMAGFNLNVGSTLTIGVNGRLLCNGGTPTYSSVVINGEVSCGTTIGITWTGLAGNNQWSTNGNWTNNTVPATNDVAIFNSKCSGANCNSNMPASVTVKGLFLNSDYTGIVTAGTNLTVGTSGHIQAGGTFVGSAASITYPNRLEINGGTYTATSGTTTINSVITLSGSPTFNHSSGQFLFTGSYNGALTMTSTSAFEFFNVSWTGGSMRYYINGELAVMGLFSVNDTDCTYNYGGDLFTGTVLVKGDMNFTGCAIRDSGLIKIAGSTNQTITSISTANIPNLEFASTGGVVNLVGTFRIVQALTNTSGNINVGTSTLFFKPYYNANITHSPGATVWNDVEFFTDQGNITVNGNFIVGGRLTIGDNHPYYQGDFVGGTIEARGDVDFVRGGLGWGGAGVLRLAGSANQTITATKTLEYDPAIPAFEIAKSGGSANFSGLMRFKTHYTYTSGTVNVGTSTFHFAGPYNSTTNLVPGSVSYYNVIIGEEGSNDFNITGTMTVTGSLTFWDVSNGSSTGILNSGTILSYGDIILKDYGKRANATTGTLVRVVGNTDQTIFGGGADVVIPNLEIASTGGTVTFAGSITFNSSNYFYTSGTVNAGSSFIFFDYSPSVTPGTPIYNSVLLRPRTSPGTNLSGTLRTAGLMWIGETYAYSTNAGSFQVYGDFLSTDEGAVGTGTTEFVGSTTSYVSTARIDPLQRHPNGLVTVNKTGGASVVLGSNFRLGETGQDLRVQSGTLNLAGSDLSVSDNVTIETAGTIICNGGTLTRTSLTNNGVFDCSSSNFSWTGAGGNTNWNTPGNWSGGVVPGVNDVALFSNTFCGSNCNATINVDPNVKGIRLASDYTGTITQGSGVSLTIGSQGWVQISGNYLGSNANKSLNGAMILSGGSYRASSGITTTGHSFGVNNSPLFDSNFGTFTFTGSSNGNISSGNIRFHHVNITGNNATFSLGGNDMKIDGNLNIGDLSSGVGGVNTGTLTVGGNVNFVNFGYAGNANFTFFGATASTVNVGASASVVRGDIRVEKLSMLTLTSTVSFTNPSTQRFTVFSGVVDLNGQTLNTRNLSLAQFTGIVCRGGTYTHTSITDLGANIACAGYPFYWTGAGANANWNTGANWSGGVAPNNTGTQIAVFTNSQCSSNCSPTLNVNPNVRGIYMMPDYTGTITQSSGIAVTIGHYGLNMAGGTFLGSNADVTIMRRVFIGAGTFRAPSSTLIIRSDDTYVNVLTGLGHFVNFQHNNGVFNLQFSCTPDSRAHYSKVHNFYSFLFNNSCTGVDWYESVLNVQNDLTFAIPGYGTSYRDLRIRVAGNVSSGQTTDTSAFVGGNYVVELIGRPAGQTISHTGSFGRLANLVINTGTHPVTLTGNQKIGQNYTYMSSGAFTTTGSTLYFQTDNYLTETLTIQPGTVNYNNVAVKISHYGPLDIIGTMNVLGDFTLHRGGYGNNQINKGILAVRGNVTLVTCCNNPNSGTATIRLTGNPSGQIISGPENVYIPNLEIAVGANPVTMSGSPRVIGSTTVTSGNVNQSGATFRTTTLSLNGSTWIKSGGVLNVGGSNIGTGALFGGTVNP